MSVSKSTICFIATSAKTPDQSQAIDIHIVAEQGITFAQAVYLSGFFAPAPLCSGLGNCGYCQMQFLTNPPTPSAQETSFFTPVTLKQGWRLGCQHTVHSASIVAVPSALLSDSLVSTPVFPDTFTDSASFDSEKTECTTNQQHSVPNNSFSSLPINAPTSPYFLGIDIGTTSLAFALCTSKGTIVKQGVTLNPQLGAGLDTVSRLAFAQKKEGQKQLFQRTLQALQNIQTACTNDYGTIASLCVAGNPTMTCLALNKSTASLATAPYALTYKGGTSERLPKLAPLWIPPQFSPFVGGDIAAALSFIEQTQQPLTYPFLVADLGTNGEFLLALSPHKFLVTSVALGPALEGIGLTFGALATHTTPVIHQFSLTPKGITAQLLPQQKLNSHVPHAMQKEHNLHSANLAITGTGYLSLLKNLLVAKAMNHEGQFTLHNAPLIQKQQITLQKSPCACPLCSPHPHPQLPQQVFLHLPHNLYVSGKDIEEILKVKAAFSLGLSLLLQKSKISTHELAAVYLAGALGEHVEKEALEQLGFFPKGMHLRMHTLGNASLKGACLLAHSTTAQKQIMQKVPSITALNLADEPGFAQLFASHMKFTW